MADDKKNIPDAGKVDEPPKPEKVEPVKADPPVQDQPAPAKTEAPVVEGEPKAVTPPAAEQPAPAGKEAPKDKDAPAPYKRVRRRSRRRSRPRSPAWGDPAPAGKVVDFTVARDGAAKVKPPEMAVAPDKGKQAEKVVGCGQAPAEAAHPRLTRRPPTRPSRNLGTNYPKANRPRGKALLPRRKPRLQPNSRTTPRDAARGVKEEIVYLNLSELHPFKNHPFGVRGRCGNARTGGVGQGRRSHTSLRWCGPVRVADMRLVWIFYFILGGPALIAFLIQFLVGCRTQHKILRFIPIYCFVITLAFAIIALTSDSGFFPWW